MALSATQLNRHPMVDTFERADESAEPYRWYIALKAPLTIPGYGGQGKHVMTVKDGNRILIDALKHRAK